MFTSIKTHNIRALLLTLGSESDLPSYRYSQLDRGVYVAAQRLSPKVAADMAISVGISVKSAIKLIQLAQRDNSIS